METQLTRRQRRQKQDGVKVFNKLLFEFVKYEAENTFDDHGYLIIPAHVNFELKRCDRVWKNYCFRIKANSKKEMGFKPEAFKDEAEKHILRHKKQVFSKYVVQLINRRYGVDISMRVAAEYTDKLFETDMPHMPDVVVNDIFKTILKMYKIEIPEINFVKEIPEDINEISNTDFVFLAGKLKQVFDGELDIYDLKTAMALQFLGVKHTKKQFNLMPDETKQKVAENLHSITDLLDFFFIEKDGKLEFNTNFNKNFIPVLNLGFFRKYYGPADALTDITWLEYKDANQYHQQYLKTRDEETLNKLIAVLYRPSRLPFGIWKHKITYKPGKIAKRAARIARLPIEQRFAIYLFYTACEQYLRTGSINVDGNDIDLSILYETTLTEKKNQPKKVYDDKTGLAGIALGLAGTGIFGNIEEVYKQNLYDVIVLLVKQRIEYLNQLENIKND